MRRQHPACRLRHRLDCHHQQDPGINDEENPQSRTVSEFLAEAQQAEVCARDAVFLISGLHMHDADIGRAADLARQPRTGVDWLLLTIRIQTNATAEKQLYLTRVANRKLTCVL